MQFDSVQALIEMNGYGGYVWSSYLVFFAVLIGLIVSSHLQFRRIVMDQRRLARIENRQSQERKDPNASGS